MCIRDSVHTAAVLGAGLALADLAQRGELPVGVRLVFQPAEEVQPGGAESFLGHGVLEGVEQIYALHCDPKIEVGTIGSRIGSITSASDPVTVTLRSHGGHTSRPHMTGDVVYALGQVIAQAAGRVGADKDVARLLEYPVFVDGLSALGRLGDLSRHGVIADGLFNYEFAVGSAPVLDYPLWPRPSSPEFQKATGIPAGADIVMILRHDAGALGSVLRERMGTAFAPCLQTGIWDVFARTGANIEGCKAS